MEKYDWQERTKLLLKDKHQLLQNSNVLVVGLGGVGSIAAEMLCRSGIGRMTIVDNDSVHYSNLNRQIFTTHSNIGVSKVAIASQKLLQINPLIELKFYDLYLKDDNIVELLASDKFDYVVDAIDTIAPKVFLIYNALKMGYRVVSSMGAGGKLDATAVKVSDISASYNCPLARLIRKRLHRLGVYRGVKVVFSTEKPDKDSLEFVELDNKKTTLGTISYMPNIFGILAAYTVVDDLLKDVDNQSGS